MAKPAATTTAPVGGSGPPRAKPAASVPAAAAGALVPMDPSPPFVFLAHPHSWDVAMVGNEALLVPSLRAFQFRGGRSGVIPLRRSAVGDPTEALASRGRLGWVQIPRSTGGKAFGEDFTDYCVGYDGTAGDVHMPVWQRPIVVGTRVLLDYDDDGWNRWRHALIGSVLDAPSAPALAALRSRLTSGQRRRANRTGSASAKAAADLFGAKLGALTKRKE